MPACQNRDNGWDSAIDFDPGRPAASVGGAGGSLRASAPDLKQDACGRPEVRSGRPVDPTRFHALRGVGWPSHPVVLVVPEVPDPVFPVPVFPDPVFPVPAVPVPVLPVPPVLVPVSTEKPDRAKVSFCPPVEQTSQPSLRAVQVLAAGR